MWGGVHSGLIRALLCGRALHVERATIVVRCAVHILFARVESPQQKATCGLPPLSLTMAALPFSDLVGPVGPQGLAAPPR